MMPPSLLVVLFALRICPTTPSIASADTKQLCGGKLAKRCLRWMPWIALNRKKEGRWPETPKENATPRS